VSTRSDIEAGRRPAREKRAGAVITLRGIVQGVGFRPFIHRLARECGLAGTVRNFSGGVVIEAEGPQDSIDEFYRRIAREAPPLARVAGQTIQSRPARGATAFSVQKSDRLEGGFVLVPPDIAMCPSCHQELLDPRDRRHRYPFINCTDCGPRLTIIEDIPYDRPMTTMRTFTMCRRCRAEYENIDDRRYHAQPNACPDCGPHLSLRNGTDRTLSGEEALQDAIGRLKRGQILAVKGIGGFHLCCDAGHDRAVEELRRRKNRPAKPLAIMTRDADRAASLCHLSDLERQLLESPARPIVILRQRGGNPISRLVAPGNNTLGIMLPYAPVHVLLLEDLAAIVATSANLSDQPLIGDNEQAVKDLAGIADGFLLHDREIHTRCDDSILRVIAAQPTPLRRARGFAPVPIQLPVETPQVLACGAELKNTFCLVRDGYAFVSQHIGDLKNVQTYRFYEQMIARFEKLFRADPKILAHDLHPQYLSTRYAAERAAGPGGLTMVPVQHHHAHVAACMAENGITDPVLGVVFDGIGYGDDGRIWGAEFMVADLAGYRRVGQLRYVPLPGGDAASREPWRMGLSYLHALGAAPQGSERRAFCGHLDPDAVDTVLKMLDRAYHVPLGSSMGRLFDAVSFLLGLCERNTYEGEAAVALQIAAEEAAGEPGRYDWSIGEEEGYLTVDPLPLVRGIIDDIAAGIPAGRIALGFHRAVADLVRACCRSIRDATGLEKVALSGGVFQNALLAEMTINRLRREGFEPLTHRQVPPNDGGISLGQAVVAAQVQKGIRTCV
jgi:hydrogenase maturation protein HypF